ncbi:Band 4.1-like protein 3 [Amphibalanus amphitrite]|uniref:Band 4.1-like protein 3 n=1 Tax=Amphibalanus amphitrite TaxID=1232801 RepID=A0A6A4WK73_AMPAM|nr:Band 4.1-like protein 3 [Amphibalanus amphitrite]
MKKANGQELFDKVAAHLELLEKDYFGLLFTDPHDPRNWLQLDKSIKKQLKTEARDQSVLAVFAPADTTIIAHLRHLAKWKQMALFAGRWLT